MAQEDKNQSGTEQEQRDDKLGSQNPEEQQKQDQAEKETQSERHSESTPASDHSEASIQADPAQPAAEEAHPENSTKESSGTDDSNKEDPRENSTEETKKETAEKTDESSDEREYYDFGDDSELHDEHDETEEDDTTRQEENEEENEEEIPDYESFTRQQLVEALEEIVGKEDLLKHKREVALIKVAYLKKTDIEKQEELEKRSEDKKAKDKADESEKQEEEAEKEESSEEESKDELQERFDQAFTKYKNKKAEYRAEQERIQQENLRKKKEILEELRELINSEETLKKTYDDFKALQEKWKEVGIVPKSEVNELWKNYHFLVEKFFDKVKINKELRDLDLKKNLEQKIELCERAEELILESSVNKSFKELQVLHEKYRQIGPVPADKKEEVWNRFKSATEKIHERRRKHYEELKQKQEKNLEAKTALCEKVEDILKRDIQSVKEWNETSDQIKELMKIWRSIGFVPRQYNESIWNRFKTSVDTFFENKKEFFKQLKDEQRDNYNKKLNLCLEAESLQESTDWKKTSRELIRLQKEWKKIGPVSRKHSDKLWKRFRAANDKFFNARDEYFKNQKDREEENLKKKEELIKKIQNQEFGSDKNENLEKMKEFQREWMNIGFVPFNKKDEVQKKYQEAINKRIDELSISNADINSAEYKSHVDNLKDMPGGDKQLRKERSKLVARVNKLKEDVKLWENNTGFLANSKNAELLKKEFQEKIDKSKREIALLEAQIKVLDSE